MISRCERLGMIFAAILLCCVLIVCDAKGDRLNYYAECRMNFEGSDGPVGGVGNLYVGHNARCDDYCSKACKKAFAAARVQSDDDDDFNQGVIDKCTLFCKKGVAEKGFSATKYGNFVVYGDIANFPTCSEESGNPSVRQIRVNDKKNGGYYTISAYESDIDASDQGTKIVVALDAKHKNIIYPYGRKIIRLDPMYPNMFKISAEVVEGGEDFRYDKMQSFGTTFGKLKDYQEITFMTDKQKKQYINKGIYFDYGQVLKPVIDEMFADVRSTKPIGYSWLNETILTNDRPDENGAASKTARNVLNPAQIMEQVAYSIIGKKEEQNKTLNEINVTAGVNPRGRHACLFALSSEDFKSLSPSDLMSCKTTSNSKSGRCGKLMSKLRSGLPNPDSVTQNNIHQHITNCYPAWHLDNDDLIDTGIIVSSGDNLTVSIGGDIIARASSVLKNDKNAVVIDTKGVKLAKFDSNYNFGKYPDGPLEDEGKQIRENINSLRSNLGTFSLDRDVKSGRESDVTRVCGSSYMKIIFTEVKNGEVSVTNFIDSPAVFKNVDPEKYSKGEVELDGVHLKCKDILDPGSIRGIFSGRYNSATKKFLIGHMAKVPRFDMIGGYQVKIAWHGLEFREGSGMENAFMKIEDFKAAQEEGPDSELWSKIKWSKDIGDMLKSGRVYRQYVTSTEARSSAEKNMNPLILPEGKYKLLFRVPQDQKRIAEYNAEDSNYVNSDSQIGHYRLAVKLHGERKSDFIIDRVKEIRKILYGTNPCRTNGIPCDLKSGKCGVVATLYNAVTKEVSRYISVLLTLYISFYAVSFLIGNVKSETNDFLNRMLKIAFILVGTTAVQSWDVIGSRLVAIGICGMESLIRTMTDTGGDVSLDNTLMQTERAVEVLFNLDQKIGIKDSSLDQYVGGVGDMIASIFHGSLTAKLQALALNSLTGLGIAIILLISLFRVAIFLIRIVLAYVFSILGLGLISVMIPVLLPLLLFEQTKHVFHSAIKYFLLYLLSPVFAFVIYVLCSSVLFVLVSNMLNFTVCKACLIDMGFLFGWDLCIMSYWTLLMTSHTAEAIPTFAPIGILMCGLACFIISTVSNALLGSITGVLTRIISVVPIGSGQGGGGSIGMGSDLYSTVADNFNYMNAMKQAVKGVRDFESLKQLPRAFIDKDYQIKKSGAKTPSEEKLSKQEKKLKKMMGDYDDL